ncbi:MAG: hypothetical protein WC969_00505 [Elusimicrobiota bacterium]
MTLSRSCGPAWALALAAILCAAEASAAVVNAPVAAAAAVPPLPICVATLQPGAELRLLALGNPALLEAPSVTASWQPALFLGRVRAAAAQMLRSGPIEVVRKGDFVALIPRAGNQAAVIPLDAERPPRMLSVPYHTAMTLRKQLEDDQLLAAHATLAGFFDAVDDPESIADRYVLPFPASAPTEPSAPAAQPLMSKLLAAFEPRAPKVVGEVPPPDARDPNLQYHGTSWQNLVQALINAGDGSLFAGTYLGGTFARSLPHAVLWAERQGSKPVVLEFEGHISTSADRILGSYKSFDAIPLSKLSARSKTAVLRELESFVRGLGTEEARLLTERFISALYPEKT